MRRSRDIRDHRDALRRKALADRKKRRQHHDSARLKAVRDKSAKKISNRIIRDKSNLAVVEMPGIHLERFENYVCTIKNPINILHVIESLGIGGGQTMMMEMVRGLNKHYGEHVNNIVVCPRPSHKNFDRGFYASYGIEPICIREKELARFQSSNNIDVVVQHRLAVSKCLKQNLISSAKYILMNHTYHQLARIPQFLKCDYYVSVCDYLHNNTFWSPHMHKSRRASILNGVENDYLDEIDPMDLAGTFKTGRCHRLVQSKFKTDSINWMDDKVAKTIPGHQHFILGFHKEAKRLCKKSNSCTAVGSVTDRKKKMSYLKALDVYFYETFAHEGASIAILESLACGVPVLCKDYGGNKELIQNGVNGYVVKDRKGFLNKMQDLANNPDELEALKKSTIEDFNTRLHVRQTSAKYMQLFEALLKE